MPPFFNAPVHMPRQKDLNFSGIEKGIKTWQDRVRDENRNSELARILEETNGNPLDASIGAFRANDRTLGNSLLSQKFAQDRFNQQQGAIDRRHADSMAMQKYRYNRSGQLHEMELQIQREKLKALKNPATDPFKSLKLQKLRAETQIAEMKLKGQTPKDLAEANKLDERTANITAGIENLAKLPSYAGKNGMDFEGAIGPFDNSGIGRALSLGDPSEGEVRRRIEGDVEALAAAIKPLIRKPGEGVWTDADQERLVAVVGNLNEARNKDEYFRALSAVKDRINSNFGMNIKDLSFDGGQKQLTPVEQEMKKRGLLD